MPNDLILVQFIHDIRNTGRGRKEQKNQHSSSALSLLSSLVMKCGDDTVAK